MPDIHLMESDEVIVFDNLTSKLSIIVYANEKDDSYDLALSRINQIEEIINTAHISNINDLSINNESQLASS